MKWTLLLLVAIALACPVMAASFDETMVNLADIRGNKVRISGSTQGNAYAPLHPLGNTGDIRLAPASGSPSVTNPAWWSLEFANGQSYNVTNYTIGFNGWSVPITYCIQYSDTGLDGSWNIAPIAGADANGYVTLASGNRVSGSFTESVSAKFIRVAAYDYKNPGSGAIINWVHLTGPNTFNVNPSFSLVQSIRRNVADINDCMPTYTDALSSTPRNASAVTNFFEQSNFFGPSLTLRKDAAGNVTPGQLTVPLSDLYEISAVGISTIDDNRRASEVKIFVSINGDKWDWVKTADISGTGTNGYYYYEIELDTAVPARFVRFDLTESISSNYSAADALGNRTASCYVAQVYVYGSSPIPEPMTMSLLALGGLALLRRRAKV